MSTKVRQQQARFRHLEDRMQRLVDHQNEMTRAHNGLLRAHRALVVEVRAYQAVLLDHGHMHQTDGSTERLTPEDLDRYIRETVAALRAEAEAVPVPAVPVAEDQPVNEHAAEIA